MPCLPSLAARIGAIAFCLTTTLPLWADEHDMLKVGPLPDGRIVVPTNQILQPAGKQVLFPGRPVDLALLDGGRTLVVKNMKSLVFIDLATGTVKQSLLSPAGFSVTGLIVQGERIYSSDVQNFIRVAKKQTDGSYAWEKPLELTKPAMGVAHPAGLALVDEKTLLATSTRGNNVQCLDLASGKVEQVIPVGVAPYAIVCVGAKRCYVSNWGGDRPGKDDPVGTTSGTPVRIDPRTSVANHGSVSVLKHTEEGWKQTGSITVGMRPAGMTATPDGRLLYVANAGSDTVSVIDTASDKVVETLVCRPEHRLPFGSGCNALVLSPDGKRLFVANGTNNCVAVLSLAREHSPPLAGLIPTGWYPGAVRLSADGKRLFVANVKGHGSLSQPRPIEKGHNSHDHMGSVSIIDLPDAAALALYTEMVNRNNRLAYSLAGLEKPRSETPPAPVPARHGEPSLIKHVLYVIKENRTYDQVFGDMKEGNGDPNLVLFGEQVTPNQHALARQFTLFDNFYCSGVLSADGHTWVNEAYVSDYLEKAFGGFARSYPYEGSDALAFANTGFLWDNALVHKKTFYNFGEYVKTTYTPKSATWSDVYNDYKNGTQKVKIEIKPNLQSLEPHSHPGYPGFPLTTPDVYRARLFLEQFKTWEQKGAMPNLVYVFLPANHTNGTRPDSPTPRAMAADNDLALGQIVEAVSKSKFWAETALFVIEDDPQNGFDHVDGHRSPCLVISPYTKRHFVDHTCYNQTGVVKTIELILGLPPMTQLDLSATPLRACFQDKADLTPFVCLPSRVALDEMNPPLKKLQGAALHWAKKSMELDLDEEDAADEDTFNRILWHAMRGEAPYPERFVGHRKPD